MSHMKQISTSEPDIVIEWRSSRAELMREDVLELARALGRLAARRDLEEAAAQNAGECLSSARKPGTMVVLEPV